MASWTLQSGPRLSTLPPLQSDTRTLWPLASVESSCTSVLHRSKLSASPHTHVRWRTHNKTRTLCSAGWDLNHFNFSKVKDFLVDFGNCHVSSQSETCWERNCFRMLLTFRASSIDERYFYFPHDAVFAIIRIDSEFYSHLHFAQAYLLFWWCRYNDRNKVFIENTKILTEKSTYWKYKVYFQKQSIYWEYKECWQRKYWLRI